MTSTPIVVDTTNNNTNTNTNTNSNQLQLKHVTEIRTNTSTTGTKNKRKLYNNDTSTKTCTRTSESLSQLSSSKSVPLLSTNSRKKIATEVTTAATATAKTSSCNTTPVTATGAATSTSTSSNNVWVGIYPTQIRTTSIKSLSPSSSLSSLNNNNNNNNINNKEQYTLITTSSASASATTEMSALSSSTSSLIVTSTSTSAAASTAALRRKQRRLVLLSRREKLQQKQQQQQQRNQYPTKTCKKRLVSCLQPNPSNDQQYQQHMYEHNQQDSVITTTPAATTTTTTTATLLSTTNLLVPATLAGVQEIANRLRLRLQLVPTICSSATTSACIVDRTNTNPSSPSSNSYSNSSIIAIPTECTYELVMMMNTNNDNTTTTTGTSLYQIVQSLQQYKHYMDKQQQHLQQQHKQQPILIGNNNTNTTNDAMNDDININEEQQQQLPKLNKMNSPNSIIPDLCINDTNSNHNNNNSTIIDYTMLPTVPFLGTTNNNGMSSSSSSFISVKTQKQTPTSSLQCSPFSKNLYNSSNNGTDLIVPHLYINSVAALNNSSIFKLLLPKKSYAIKLRYPSTSTSTSTSTGATNIHSNNISTTTTSSDTSTKTRTIIASFNESIIVLQLLAKQYWPGSVKMYVAVPNLQPTIEKNGTDMKNSNADKINSYTNNSCTSTNDDIIQDMIQYLTLPKPDSSNTDNTASCSTTSATTTAVSYLAIRCPSHPLARKVLRECTTDIKLPILLLGIEMSIGRPQLIDNNKHIDIQKQQSNVDIDETTIINCQQQQQLLQTTTQQYVTTSLQACMVATGIEHQQQQKLHNPSYVNRFVKNNSNENYNNSNECCTAATATISGIMNGEQQYEMFTVPTCEYKQPCTISIWIDSSTRVITIRNNQKRMKQNIQKENKNNNTINQQTNNVTYSSSPVLGSTTTSPPTTSKLLTTIQPNKDVITTPDKGGRKRGFSITVSPDCDPNLNHPKQLQQSYTSSNGTNNGANHNNNNKNSTSNDDEFQCVALTDFTCTEDDTMKHQLLYDPVDTYSPTLSPDFNVGTNTNNYRNQQLCFDNKTLLSSLPSSPSSSSSVPLFPEVTVDGVLNALHGFKAKSLKERVVKSVLMKWKVVLE